MSQIVPNTYEGFVYRKMVADQSLSRQKWKRRHLRWDPIKEMFTMHITAEYSAPVVWSCASSQLDSVRRLKETVVSEAMQENAEKIIEDQEEPTMMEKIILFWVDLKTQIKFGCVSSSILHLKFLDQRNGALLYEMDIATETEDELEKWCNLFSKILNSRWYNRVSSALHVSSIRPSSSAYSFETYERLDPPTPVSRHRSVHIINEAVSSLHEELQKIPLPKRLSMAADQNLQLSTRTNLTARSSFTKLSDVTNIVNMSKPLPSLPATPMKASMLLDYEYPHQSENHLESLLHDSVRISPLHERRCPNSSPTMSSLVDANISEIALSHSGLVHSSDDEIECFESNLRVISREFQDETKSPDILVDESIPFIQLELLKEQSGIFVKILSIQREIEEFQDALDSDDTDRYEDCEIVKELLHSILVGCGQIERESKAHIKALGPFMKTDSRLARTVDQNLLNRMSQQFEIDLDNSMGVLKSIQKSITKIKSFQDYNKEDLQFALESMKRALTETRAFCRWIYSTFSDT